jgi:peptidoglycan/LPS O-acetylase OafA/YrhL
MSLSMLDKIFGFTTGTQPVHSTALDGLRGLSAQIVFISHFIALVAPLPSAFAQHIFSWSARTAVIVFFCLSGFVIMSSILRSTRQGTFDPMRYGVRRVARVYPPYLLAIALCWVVWAVQPVEPALAAGSVLGQLGRALCFLMFSNDVVSRFDGPLWSLRLEVICYVIAGLLAYGWSRRVAAPVPAYMALAGALLLCFTTPVAFTFGMSAFAWFGLGAIAAAGLLSAVVPWGLFGAAVLFLAGAPLTWQGPFAIGAADTALAMAFQVAFAACISAYIAQLSTLRDHPLAVFSPLGAFSYTLYVIHFPIIVLAGSFGVASSAGAAAIFVGVEIVAVMAARLVERPSNLSAAIFAQLDRLGWSAGSRSGG